ncbi:carboxylesterase family domain-containing protein [Ditylenchus destructor]|uniref:Carboxylesterase family domain-containing protein n=1 Tax=Ditylenchus destructor TaxID=166010 RepID=A0A8F2Z188_9BILA|nr:carboxylesterase family domain-containing protein [Ditylenchus destructor]QWX94376.1 putative gut esterase 1 [Ditylenchus destructor]
MHVQNLILLLLLNYVIPIITADETEQTANEYGPIVQTLNGPVEGFQIDLDASTESSYTTADIFMGIPYAQAPIDDLRLEKPSPANNWTDVLHATELPPSCVPLHLLASFDYSEDCLFLNIFRPSKLTEDSELLPVLIFIHGGGFNLGGAFVEGYQNFSNNFVSQGIIVVTIQYRLGILGFFSDGSKELPGNLGLWDQREALIWIQKNIAAFHGDPKRVTLFGQSAGSASVSMLTISRHTRDLFQQAIQQSGSFLSPWAMNNRVVDTSLESAKALNCSLDDSTALKECLKQMALEDILFGIGDIEMTRADFEIVVYNPRVDGDFFDADPLQLVSEAAKKPTMIGFNSHEGMFLTLEYPDSVFAFRSPLKVEDPRTFDTEKDLIKCILEKVRNRVAGVPFTSKNRRAEEKLQRDLIQYYTRSGKWALKKKSKEFPFFLEKYTQLFSDVLFIIPALWEAKQKVKSGWSDVYLYQFDHVNRKMLKKLPFRGVVHGGEYPYTIGVHIFGNYELDKDDLKVKETINSALVQFVKTGSPSTTKLFWPAMDSVTKLRNARIGPKSIFEVHPKSIVERLQFWETLDSKYNLTQFYGLPTIKRVT